MHAADAMVAAVPEVRAADLAIRPDIKYQEVSAKGFGRAIKKSRRQGSWPSNQEVSASRKLAEQPRSLGVKEVGRATKESRRQGSGPSNQEVSASRKLAEQQTSLGVKEVGRAIKESSDHEKSLRTMKRVFGP